MRCANRGDTRVAAGIHFGPAFSGQLAVYVTLDPILPDRIARLNFHPVIGFVLREVCGMIVVSVDVSRERDARERGGNE